MSGTLTQRILAVALGVSLAAAAAPAEAAGLRVAPLEPQAQMIEQVKQTRGRRVVRRGGDGQAAAAALMIGAAALGVGAIIASERRERRRQERAYVYGAPAYHPDYVYAPPAPVYAAPRYVDVPAYYEPPAYATTYAYEEAPVAWRRPRRALAPAPRPWEAGFEPPLHARRARAATVHYAEPEPAFAPRVVRPARIVRAPQVIVQRRDVFGRIVEPRR